MPIYSYRCENCGHAEDVLQKMSAPQLTVCPACGADAYRKQVTAAGFQLKGSGWYVTDFRSPQAAPGAPKKDGKDSADAAPASDAKPEGKSEGTATPPAAPTDGKTASKPDAAPSAPAPKAPPATSG